MTDTLLSRWGIPCGHDTEYEFVDERKVYVCIDTTTGDVVPDCPGTIPPPDLEAKLLAVVDAGMTIEQIARDILAHENDVMPEGAATKMVALDWWERNVIAAPALADALLEALAALATLGITPDAKCGHYRGVPDGSCTYSCIQADCPGTLTLQEQAERVREKIERDERKDK